jgi:HK97 family phage major capsid protein
MNQFERQITAIRQKQTELVDQFKAIYAQADEESRATTEDENKEIQAAHRAIETLEGEKKLAEEGLKTLKDVEDLGRSLGAASPSITVGSEPHDRVAAALNGGMFQAAQKTLGEAFVDSDAYTKAINVYRESGGRFPEHFSSGVSPLEMKGTLLEGSGGGGGALAATVPQVVSGAVNTLFQRLTVSDLMLSGQASTNSIRYVIEGTATSGAAGVAEGGTKPESTVGLTTTDEPIKKIATLLPISEEMLEDAPAVQSYINGRLQLFVQIEEERQLIRGTSGGNEVQGLLTSRNVPVFAGTSVDDKATQLFKGANSMRGSAFIEPEWLILHPTDWQTIRLLKDGAGGTVGQFFGGGPFLGPYGGPQGPVGMNSQVAGPTDMIWNLPTIVSAVTGAGTAVVGTRASAQVWRRGGISVEASNSHSNYFQLNLIAIRAEERLGLAVYRPKGFVEVRLA